MGIVWGTEYLRPRRKRSGMAVLVLSLVVGVPTVLSVLTLSWAKLSGDITGESTLATWLPWGPWVVIALTFGAVILVTLVYVCIKNMDEAVPPPFSN